MSTVYAFHMSFVTVFSKQLELAKVYREIKTCDIENVGKHIAISLLLVFLKI